MLVKEMRRILLQARVLDRDDAFARRRRTRRTSAARSCSATTRAQSVLDPFCRAHDVENLFVVDASFFPSSAAVNPALTIAAQALRVADHIRTADLSAAARPTHASSGESRPSLGEGGKVGSVRSADL